MVDRYGSDFNGKNCIILCDLLFGYSGVWVLCVEFK